MSARPLSPLRKGLLWWFAPPASPWVSGLLAVDVAPALGWLAHLREVHGEAAPRLHHLVAAAIARTLQAFPDANAGVVGDQIVRYPHVGLAMPVNRLGAGEEEGMGNALGLALLERAETMTLRQIADATRRQVREERAGRITNPFLKTLERAVGAAPQSAVDAVLGGIDRAANHPLAARALHAKVPVTTALSNAGAAFKAPEGAWLRAVHLAIPPRLVHLGTFWGLSAVQQEVVPVDGVPAVRPILPVLHLFDHRILDGYRDAQLLTHFAGLLREPAKVFGEDGEG